MKEPEFSGVTFRDASCYCAGCGTEIQEGMMHIASYERTEEYSINTFACNNCGNLMSVKFFEERGKADEKVCD